MSDLLSQRQIEEITEATQPAAQERILRDMGYVVLRCRSARGRVRALATHPEDPRLKAEGSKHVALDFS
jgi:hypothetical protein